MLGDDSSGTSDNSNKRQRSQPSIQTALHQQAEKAYYKLLKTAYMMALDGLPLSSFATLVKIQKANGVPLIQGTHSSNKAKEFIHEIADAIRRKIASIICKTPFSVLSDGSQARKTSSEKELVFVRVVRDGVPVYFVASLQDIDSYGDATAENLFKSINNTFEDKVKITPDSYTNFLVSATADGAAVNTGEI